MSSPNPVQPIRPVQSPLDRSSLPPARSPPDRSSPQLDVDDHEASDLEEEEALEPEIDEQSDGEDEHQAYALLHAAPSPPVATPLRQTLSTVTQHSSRSFAVRILTLIR